MIRKNLSRRPAKSSTHRLLESLESRTLLSAASFITTTIPVGVAPVAVAVGDFNHDGRLDQAVVNQGDGTVGILLGNGNGSFQPMVAYLVGTTPTAIAVGDFNRDGNLDLAVTSTGSNSVGILIGNGDGSFGIATAEPAGAQPVAVKTADFNRDGITDLVVANFLGNSVGILLGNGDGTFQAMSSVPTHNGPTDVAIGDFNRDGIPDLAVASQSTESVDILLGDGQGGFNPFTNILSGGEVTGIVTADFNHDGKLDLAFSDADIAAVGVTLGNGDGSFGQVLGYSTGSAPLSITTGDFNADGKIDLAVANTNGNSVSVLPGTGTGAFGPRTNFTVGSLPVSVTAADLNSDGRTDLVAANSSVGSLSVLLNTNIPLVIGGSLQFVNQPAAAAAGVTLAPITVNVLDSNGVLVPSDHSSVTLSIATGPDHAKIVGTVTVQAVNGVATFSHISLPLAGDYTLTAKRTGEASATSDSFTISAAAPAKLLLVDQPKTAIAGAPLSVTVNVVDAFGNLVTTDTSNVTIAVHTSPKNSAPITGTLTIPAVNGVATFSDLALTTIGSYTLQATDGALKLVNSKTIKITAHTAAAHLVITQQPAPTPVNAKLAPKLIVKIEDDFGNVITADHSRVTLALVSGPGVLSGTLSVKASSGVATFSNVKASLDGAYVLELTDPTLADPTPVDFNQTIVPLI